SPSLQAGERRHSPCCRIERRRQMFGRSENARFGQDVIVRAGHDLDVEPTPRDGAPAEIVPEVRPQRLAARANQGDWSEIFPRFVFGQRLGKSLEKYPVFVRKVPDAELVANVRRMTVGGSPP